MTVPRGYNGSTCIFLWLLAAEHIFGCLAYLAFERMAQEADGKRRSLLDIILPDWHLKV
jgi:hypothetical protein